MISCSPVINIKSCIPDAFSAPTSSKPVLDTDTPAEEGEEMDVTTVEEESMAAMMGLRGFGSTKVRIPFPTPPFPLISIYTSQGKRVEGNQEGTANVKKIRTWRQYMNRCVLYLCLTERNLSNLFS